MAGEMVVGRQSASGGFLKGFIRHDSTDTIYYYADSSASHDEFIADIESVRGDKVFINMQANNLLLKNTELVHLFGKKILLLQD